MDIFSFSLCSSVADVPDLQCCHCCS